MMRDQHVAVRVLLLILMTVAGPWTAAAQSSSGELNECVPLKEVEGINVDDMLATEPKYNFRKEATYFCSTDAPPHLRCKCGIASICYTAADPWGRDIGECGCCTTWIIILFGAFIFVIFIVLVVGLYACMCHGTWLYDGYPPPLTPMLPQRTAPVIAPAAFPLPANLFRGYRSADFFSGDGPPPQPTPNTPHEGRSRRGRGAENPMQRQPQPPQQEGLRRRDVPGAASPVATPAAAPAVTATPDAPAAGATTPAVPGVSREPSSFSPSERHHPVTSSSQLSTPTVQQPQPEGATPVRAEAEDDDFDMSL